MMQEEMKDAQRKQKAEMRDDISAHTLQNKVASQPGFDLKEIEGDVRELQIQLKTNLQSIESLTEEIARLDKNIALVGRNPT
jgi:hypothetical protein